MKALLCETLGDTEPVHAGYLDVEAKLGCSAKIGYPGKAAYTLTEKTQVIPLADVHENWDYP